MNQDKDVLRSPRVIMTKKGRRLRTTKTSSVANAAALLHRARIRINTATVLRTAKAIPRWATTTGEGLIAIARI